MFKVGDKVVCIDVFNSVLSENKQKKIELNKIYIVKKSLGWYIQLYDVNFNYLSERFILLSEYRKMKINKILYEKI